MQAESKYRILQKYLIYIGIILIWQLVFYVTTDVMGIWKPYMFPNPVGVVETFIKLCRNGSLIRAIATSLRRVFLGFILSIIFGAILGTLIYRFKILNEAIKPIILGLQTLPSICWVPFAILWFGLSEAAILFVIIIGSMFSITIAVESGLSQVNPQFIRAGKTMGASNMKIFTGIIVPAALPQIISGLKQAWSFSWRALMNGEMLSATIGLGQVLMYGRDLADINQVMCVMIVIIILGMVMDKLLFGVAERKMRTNRGLEGNSIA